MFLTLAHTNLDVYKYSYSLTLEVYRLSKHLPDAEKFNLISQLRRAALSVHLNIAEGSSRKFLVERKRYYEIARGSIIEIDAALDVTVGIDYTTKTQLAGLGEIIANTFKALTGLIDGKKNKLQ
jgi:four helix bundle protein